MYKYPKVHSAFKRDPDNNYKTFLDEFSLPEFEYLKDNKWLWTEKVDGTNTRVIWSDRSLKFKGKKEVSDMPDHLESALEDMFYPIQGDLEEIFRDKNVCFYGEGYGEKIQRGAKYCNDHHFVVFDIKIDGIWLKREDIENICHSLGIGCVPIIGKGTIEEAVDLVKEGFKSKWGDFTAEGLILKPTVPLSTRLGDPIITKLKHSDYE